MSRAAGTWQGSLRSSSTSTNIVNNTMDVFGAGPLRAKRAGNGTLKGGPRSAFGDITNMGAGTGNPLGFRAGKKATSKPFAVPTQFIEQKSDSFSSHESLQAPTAMEQDYDGQLSIHHTPLPEIDRADVNDVHNPKYAAEYVNEIYKHYRAIETKYAPAPNYMDRQTDINIKMRALLVDWLIQVHVKFELLPQTLYLTVNVLDRFLERKVVPRRKLQLVGCAAMLVASKYEEIYAPECEDFVSMSDKAFTAEELLKMESILLNELNFNLTTPSPYTFLRRFMKVAGSSAKTQHFATFLVERSLQEYDMLVYKPSLLAASALFIANSLTTESARQWGSTLTRHSTYCPEDLGVCVEHMRRLYTHNQKEYLQAVSKKYSSSKYMHVSMISIA